jgi:phosphoglycerate dehydrogenase-like enzyme
MLDARHRTRISVSGPPLDENLLEELAELGQSVEPVDLQSSGWEALDGCWAHILGGTETVDQIAARMLPDSVELVCFLGTGFQSQLDVSALHERNVVTCYTPHANARSTAEFALCLVIAGLREIVAGVRQVERCEWSPPCGRSLSESTVGVVGLGCVGRELVMMLAKGFGVTPLVWNRTPRDEAIREAGGRPADLESIFANCDAISLHAAQALSDPPLIDARVLESARSELVLVNTARGRLIDPAALRAALERDPTMRVLADVYPQEPTCKQADPFGLLDLGPGRFLLTPHMAYSTRDSAQTAGEMVVANLKAHLTGQPVPYLAHS